MKHKFSAFAKRAVALSLALVLLLSLIPAVALTVDAVQYTAGWEPIPKYSWVNGAFITSDTDLDYEDDQEYDWYFGMWEQRTDAVVRAVATITDENGNEVSSLTATATVKNSATPSVVFSYDKFTELTKNLFGTFTLVCDVYLDATNEYVGTLTQTFSRISTDPLSVTVSSRSNPDNVFTVADPIDLVLNIKKNDTVATAYNAAITVTNSSGTELLAARDISLPASKNTVLSVKDLLTDLPSIQTAGTYKVNLTLTDSSDKEQFKESYPFSVIDLVDSVNVSITSDTSSSMAFNKDQAFDLTLNLEKTDGVAEDLIANITVTGSGSFSEQVTCPVPASGTFTYTPSLSSLPAEGDFTMTVVLTDDAGNARGSVSVDFRRADLMTLEFSFTGSANGNIYTNSSSIPLSLRITHFSSRGKRLTVKVTSSVNGTKMETSKILTLGAGGITSTNLNSYMPYYGVYDSVTVTVYDHSTGAQLAQETYEDQPFSRVLSTATPGDLPLLNMNVHYTNMTLDPMLQQVNFAALAGAKMWRSSITWDVVEKSEGNYAIPGQVISVLGQTSNLGMQALIILAYNNEIYSKDKGLVPTDEAWLDAYAGYCRFVAEEMAKDSTYKECVVGFEIWNEWNHATMSKIPDGYRTGTIYAEVVKRASEQIRAVNKQYGTNFKVIAGATAGDGYLEPGENPSNTYTFMNQFFSVAGIMNYFDGFSFHTYSSTETTAPGSSIRTFEYISPTEHDFNSRFASVKARLQNANKEIWLTETGWATHSEPEYSVGTTDNGKTHITTGATEQEQAAYMVQLYTWALADGTVDRIFWYDLLNDCNSYKKNGSTVWEWRNNLTECNYGLLHTWRTDAGAPLSYSAKQGYVTMCALSSKLGNATYTGTVNLGDGVEAYKFTKDGQTMVVAWTTSDITKTLTCSGSMTVTDMYGNATSGLTTATLSECPIYIVYSGTLSAN